MKLPFISWCDREDFFLNRVKKKRILHLGCADWPFTRERTKSGDLLHAKLASSAREIYGMDASEQGLEVMKSAGFQNLFHSSPTKSLFETLDKKFEIVVAGEILEHVGDPLTFIHSIATVCNRETWLIISVPNFSSIKRFPRLLIKNEAVHPDHFFYFSFSTLKKLLNTGGFEIVEFFSYWRGVSIFSRLLNPLFKRVPFFQYYSDGFCLSAILKDQTN